MPANPPPATQPRQAGAPDDARLHEVRATFASAEAMQNAADQLALHGFDRADLSLPNVDAPPENATPEAGASPADTEEDARQARTVHTSIGASIAVAGVPIQTASATRRAARLR